MLLNLREYHRPGEGAPAGRQPDRLDRALELLARSHIHTVVLAGGDTLVGSEDDGIEAVVDLQGLGLEGVTMEAGRVWIGAMTTRSALAGGAVGPGALGQIVATAAARWGGSVQRNRATVGGAVAVAASNDPLLAVLLACDGSVALLGKAGVHEVSLVEFLRDRRAILNAPNLITDVSVPWPASAPQPGVGLAIVARTPADAPIVVACASIALEEGRCSTARLALGGVADLPVRAPEAEARLAGHDVSPELIAAAAGEASAHLRPAGDFRGSAEYRQAMAAVLSERALQEAWDRAK